MVVVMMTSRHLDIWTSGHLLCTFTAEERKGKERKGKERKGKERKGKERKRKEKLVAQEIEVESIKIDHVMGWLYLDGGGEEGDQRWITDVICDKTASEVETRLKSKQQYRV